MHSEKGCVSWSSALFCLLSSGYMLVLLFSDVHACIVTLANFLVWSAVYSVYTQLNWCFLSRINLLIGSFTVMTNRKYTAGRSHELCSALSSSSSKNFNATLIVFQEDCWVAVMLAMMFIQWRASPYERRNSSVFSALRNRSLDGEDVTN